MNEGDGMIIDMIGAFTEEIGNLLIAKGTVSRNDWDLMFYRAIKKISEKHGIKLRPLLEEAVLKNGLAEALR